MAPKKKVKTDNKDKSNTVADESKPMDKSACSRMIGLLKYKAKEGSAQQEEAQEALNIYKSCNQAQKRSFLQSFESSGGGKGKDGLKFITTLKRTISVQDKIGTGHTLNMLTRPQIMQKMGMQDLKGDDADKVFQALLADNKKEFEHNGLVVSHPTHDILTKYKWVTDHGARCSQETTKTESIQQKAPVASAEQAKKMTSILDEPAAKSDVKEELAGSSKLTAGLTSIKQQLAALGKLHTQLRSLRTRLQVKSRSDALLRQRPEELGKSIDGLATFVATLELAVAEADEVLEKYEGADEVARKVSATEGLAVTADHHIGGAKEGLKRYTALLG